VKGKIKECPPPPPPREKNVSRKGEGEIEGQGAPLKKASWAPAPKKKKKVCGPRVRKHRKKTVLERKNFRGRGGEVNWRKKAK